MFSHAYFPTALFLNDDDHADYDNDHFYDVIMTVTLSSSHAHVIIWQ